MSKPAELPSDFQNAFDNGMNRLLSEPIGSFIFEVDINGISYKMKTGKEGNDSYYIAFQFDHEEHAAIVLKGFPSIKKGDKIYWVSTDDYIAP